MTLADWQLTGGMKTYCLPVIMLLNELPSTKRPHVTQDPSEAASQREVPGGGPKADVGDRGRDRDLKKNLLERFPSDAKYERFLLPDVSITVLIN